MSMQSGFDINQLVKEAQTRWLKPAEVHFILQNHESYQITEEPPKKPPSGSLFLFNKRVLRFFRRDGHSWRKKKDGRSVGEAHERLKVGNVEALNCYYAHGEENPNFQRRSFWMLDPAYEHIVLVHYREISEGRLSSGLMSELSPGCSSTLSQSPSSYTTQNPCSISFTDLRDSYRNHTSPGSTEVSSETIATDNASYHCDGIDRSGNLCTSSEVEVGQALRKLEEQLSLDDESFKDYVPEDYQDANANGFGSVHDPCYSGYAGVRSDLNGDCKVSQSHSFGKMQRVENGESLSWSDVLELFEGPVHANSAGERAYMSNGNGNQSSPLSRTIEHRKNDQSQSVYATDSKEDLMLLVKDVENLSMPTHSLQTYNSESCTTLLDQGQFGMLPVTDSSLTIAQDQRFTIREVSPEWGFTTESTKVIIIGSFLCNPTECEWACMFGDVEVPLQIIQDGVFSCQAPPHHPGKVTLCITSGNRESCSEVREFEYRDKHSSCSHCHTRPQGEATRSTEELLLLVRFAQMLLCNSSPEKEDSNELGIDLAAKLKTDEDLWGQIIEALLVGSWTSSATVDWLLQELLKDKLQQWVSSKSQENSVSKKEQGVIHMIAALGYEWALNPILRCGVGVNFRDLNGWTALHWAARFGREKMVAALIASGASAVAVTDPNSQDPTGKPPASIAEENGHKGLAGYLSEVSLTSHLSSLTLEETELAKGSADVQAELAVNNISNASVASTEDQVSMKHTLAAVRNAAQAAARIQSAFRAHSFRKRQDREAAMAADEYGFNTKDIKGLSAMSKLAFRNKAALSIQKNYRGWKGRKDFLTLRQKVVKIQAHVRGYQVRKKYKVICWAVGVLDKVVLRWRRKGAGLRGFKHESECINESEEDEDIVKVFRKEKVNVAIDEAVTRVLSMVESPEARKQYQRVLERCQEAKAELGALQSEGASASRVVASDMDDDDIFRFL